MSIFQSTFRASTANQIRARQTAIANRTPASIQYYNSRNAWIRMSSAVNVGGKNTLASQYVLQGGTPTSVLGKSTPKSGVGNTTSNAYSTVSPGGVKHDLGIRPMPGITGIEVASRSAYGSLRSIVVNYVAWDIKQLEDLELLYMRPGYTVLIEWGWAPYLTSGGLISSQISYTDIISKTPSQDQIYKELFTKSEGGNYEATYGKIQNYSWKARPDGGYDCSTTIITIGEIMDSLKVNFSPFNIPSVETNGILANRLIANDTTRLSSVQNAISGAYSQNVISGICAELYELTKTAKNKDKVEIKEGIYEVIERDTKVTYTLYKSSIKEASPENNNTEAAGNVAIYITLESFVNILNRYVLIHATDASGDPNPYIKLDTNSSTLTTLPTGSAGGQPLLCLGHTLQLSTNPSICLIANPAWENPSENLGISSTYGNRFKTFIQTAISKNKGYFYNNEWQENKSQYGIIGNIFVNLNFIRSLVTDKNVEALDKKEKNDISLATLIKGILSGINDSIGNVANLSLHCDPMDGNVIRIIDINYVDAVGRKEAYDNAFVFEMQKVDSPNGSIVRSYSFESQIFPEQSAIVAIGAQVQAGAPGSDSGTLIDFNKNITDRIMPAKIVPGPVIKDPNERFKKESGAFKGNLEILTTFIGDPDKIPVGTEEEKDTTVNVNEAAKYSGALRDIINYFKNNFKNNNRNRGIIPTKLSLIVDGIGGIIIGNMFRIPDRMLPTGYKGDKGTGTKIGFLVTELKHSIQNNDWTTTINCQYIILDEPGGSSIAIKDVVAYVQNNSNYAAIKPSAIPPGLAGDTRAMLIAGNAIFGNNPEEKGVCASYTYNLARAYTEALNNKAPSGTLVGSGGNANDLGYRLSLERLGYKQYNIGTISQADLINIINNGGGSGPWQAGDIINYRSVIPSSTHPNAYQYGHTQIYTGGILNGSNGVPWASSKIANYGTGMVYSSLPGPFEVYVFKKAVGSSINGSPLRGPAPTSGGIPLFNSPFSGG